MNFKDYAKKQTSLSPLMSSGEKIEMETLLGKEITIKDFDFITMSGDTFAVFTIAELNGFAFAGAVLSNLLKDMEDKGFKEDIRTQGLPVKLTQKISKTNQKYVAVEVI